MNCQLQFIGKSIVIHWQHILKSSLPCWLWRSGELVRQGTSTCLWILWQSNEPSWCLKLTERDSDTSASEGNPVSRDSPVEIIEMMNERLIVGYPSSFAVYSVQGDAAPIGMSFNLGQFTLRWLFIAQNDTMLIVISTICIETTP